MKLDYRAGIAYSRSSLGRLAFLEGNYPVALSFLEDAVALIRKLDFNYVLPPPLTLLGLLALQLGNIDAARTYLEESLTSSHKMGAKLYLSQTLTGLAKLVWHLWSDLKQPDTNTTLKYMRRVAFLGGAISALLTSTGSVMFRPFPELYEQIMSLALVNMNEATFKAAFAEGQALSMDEILVYALAE